MLRWTCLLNVLAFSFCTHRFTYINRPAFRRSIDCNLCYDDDCLLLDQDRCDYYVQADFMLRTAEDDNTDEVDNPALKAEVDDLLFELTERASGMKDMDCIPFVSRYTNCNKENICVGCTTCSCDASGRWNCTTADLCHFVKPPVNIDHTMLQHVVDNIIRDEHVQNEVEAVPKKIKRSAPNTTTEDMTKDKDSTDVQEILDWFYKDKSQDSIDQSTQSTYNGTEEVNTTTTTSANENASTLSTLTVLTTTNDKEQKNLSPNTDSLEFDEVLQNIAVETKNYTRKYLPLQMEFYNKTFDIDYMLADDNSTFDNKTSASSKEVRYMTNLIEGEDVMTMTEPNIDDSTKMVIDLLDTATEFKSLNLTDGMGFEFDYPSDIIEYNAINIMKRDISSTVAPITNHNMTILQNNTNIEKQVNETCTHIHSTNIYNDIVLPLNKVLGNLKEIKEKLLKYGIVTEIDCKKIKLNITNTSQLLNNLNLSSLSTPRRENSVIIEKYAMKLKRDIFEVLKDILQIQKVKETELPDDLNILIRAMKFYIRKTKSLENDNKKKNVLLTRRSDTNACTSLSFKDCFILILQAINKDMPRFNALGPLTLASRKIVKDFIQNHYTDKLSMMRWQVQDLKNNVMDDLTIISNKWQDMANNLVSASPFTMLYKIKLLHFILIIDIGKMEDIVNLIDVGHSRRMTLYTESSNDTIIDNINISLQAMHNKLMVLIKNYGQQNSLDQYQQLSEVNKVIHVNKKDKHKRHSFMKHIRRLLKNSKKDIDELLHGNNAEIVKHLARNKLDQLTQQRYNEYEEIMKKWQKNLDIVPRRKRSVMDTISGKIKNIIPKYLRHKVNPKIQRKKNNRTQVGRKPNPKIESTKKKRKHGRKNTKITTASYTKIH